MSHIGTVLLGHEPATILDPQTNRPTSAICQNEPDDNLYADDVLLVFNDKLLFDCYNFLFPSFILIYSYSSLIYILIQYIMYIILYYSHVVSIIIIQSGNDYFLVMNSYKSSIQLWT